jgi:predicted transcriptional regulator
MPSCGVCTDFTDELADISVGGAYPLEGWSTVIVRTKAGEEFFNKAVEEGVLKTQPIEDQSSVYERVIKAAMQKRTAGLKKAGELERTYGYTFVSTIPLRETEALANVKVQEVMTKDVVTVDENVTIDRLLDLMVKKHHVGYPVLDEKGNLVGIVTLEEASQVDKARRKETRVGQVMRKKLIKVHPEETGLDIFKKMSEHEIGRVVVVDPDNKSKLIGIVTKSDLVEILLKPDATK